jgi:hypothetical protein
MDPALADAVAHSSEEKQSPLIRDPWGSGLDHMTSFKLSNRSIVIHVNKLLSSSPLAILAQLWQRRLTTTNCNQKGALKSGCMQKNSLWTCNFGDVSWFWRRVVAFTRARSCPAHAIDFHPFQRIHGILLPHFSSNPDDPSYWKKVLGFDQYTSCTWSSIIQDKRTRDCRPMLKCAGTGSTKSPRSR